jgi:DNA-binding IclR family transcriptional regulator
VAVPIRAGAQVVAALGVVVPSLQPRERDRLVSAMQVAGRGVGRSLPPAPDPA